ncbi:MAG TPA: S8 family serine peptidase, partial [Jatrophihabitantaceae bacterium]|nr:S8 family serine peptidase [Jatrophihabitantaceae bacterium]
QWDHWPALTSTDIVQFNYQQYDPNTGSGIGSVHTSVPAVGDRPVLGFDVSNSSTSDAFYAVWVRLPSGTPHYRYDLSYWGDVGQSLYAFLSPAAAAKQSITEPASSPYALGVGAADVGTSQLEQFSSQGPTIDGRVKPDITGFDGVSSNLPHFAGGFYGTSAAAPHVAGAAALVKGANPNMDAAQIQDLLERRAGTSPPNNQTGHGVLNLGAPNGVTPPTGSGYTSLASPQRILDTRTTIGGHKALLGPTQFATVTVPNNLVPADATAVAINLTGTSVKQTTFLASYPGGSTWPGTSNVNLTTADSTAAVFAVVTLGPNHTINVRNQAGSVNAIVDLLGYYAPSAAGKYGAVGPTRIVDTRNGLGGHTGALTNTQTVQFHLPAGSGVPADATSVIVNVTATGQTRTGYLALSPNCSGASSTVNYLQAGYTRANLTIAGLDASGGFCVYNSGGPAQAIIDLVGYVGPSGTALYVPFTAPVRIVDTRTGNGGQLAPLGADSKITENDAGIFDVPYGAKALLTGVVSANASAASYFEVFPGTSPPAQATSTLNFTKGRVVSNAAIASLSGGTFGVYNRFGTASAIIDLFGYFV